MQFGIPAVIEPVLFSEQAVSLILPPETGGWKIISNRIPCEVGTLAVVVHSVTFTFEIHVMLHTSLTCGTCINFIWAMMHCIPLARVYKYMLERFGVQV